MFLRKLLIITITMIIGNVNGDEDDIDAIFENQMSPSFASRVHLYSTYSSIPYSNEWRLFMDYQLLQPVNSSIYTGKVVEFDSFGYMNHPQTVFHKLPYLIANPSLRTPHVSPKWCHSTEFFKIGFRIYQTYQEAGLPYQIPCAACQPIIEGLNNMYFVYPERDFTREITILSIDTRKIGVEMDYCSREDCEQNPRVAKLEDYLRVNDLYFGEWSKWSGEHATSEKDRELLGSPNGQFSIFSRNINEGFTTMCGMELNDEVISTNIFVNSDVVGDKPMTYKDYETLEIKVNTVKNETMNLEIFVNWDDWGCCSACCCPPAVCGHEYQTSSSCQNVFSARSRVGHLFIRKIKPEEGLKLTAFSESISKIFTVPPYSSKGVAIFSSILNPPHMKHALKEIRLSLFPNFLAANNASNYTFSSGMFIGMESCKDHEQKTDCSKWAECHNVSLADALVQDHVELAADTCHQVHFVDVLVGVAPLKVKVGEHENLRIRMDPEVHNMNKTKAKWRVNLRSPKKYNKNLPCLLQGTVLRNGELLILDFTKYDLKIDVILNEEQKVRIVFVNSKREEDRKKFNKTIILWALVIIAFFLLLVSAVVFMHREKTRRLEKNIKARGIVQK